MAVDLLPLIRQAAPYLEKAYKWGKGNDYVRAGAIHGLLGVGSYLGGNLLGGGYSKQYEQQLGDQMKLLQQQMRRPGKTPTGQAIQNVIKQQSKQAQQAIARSAAQRGQTGTSAARAPQMRELGRRSEQQAAAMAQLATGAQSDYTNLLSAQERLAAEERQRIGGIMNFIAKGIADVATRKLMMEVMQAAMQAPAATTGSSAQAPMQSGSGSQQPVATSQKVLPAPPRAIDVPAPDREGVQYPSNLIQRAPAQTQELPVPTQAMPEMQAIPEPMREGIRYPSALIQRREPVYENIPQQEEYARQVVEQLNRMPATPQDEYVSQILEMIAEGRIKHEDGQRLIDRYLEGR